MKKGKTLPKIFPETLKKDHQITHIKIICTTVEETHIIYG
jgi:hypothetical protein